MTSTLTQDELYVTDTVVVRFPDEASARLASERYPPLSDHGCPESRIVRSGHVIEMRAHLACLSVTYEEMAA